MQARTVAVMQSNYLPWKGYFDIIHDADLFVFYDDVQFTKSDWRHRNRVKAASGSQWLSVPVGQSHDRLLCDVEISGDNWQRKHWQTLLMNYGKCRHFERYREYFEHTYLGTAWCNLSDLNQSLIRHISLEFLGIKTQFSDSREFQSAGKKLDRLLHLLGQTGATRYVSGPAAKGYVLADRFSQAGIELVWKDYGGYPEYSQRFPPFEHGVSIIDLLFNVGPDASRFIWGWRTGATAT